MRQMFFGQFLLEEQVIGEPELRQALEVAGKEHVRLGTLGIELGLLTEEDVSHLHQQQRTRDQRFGELAVEFDLLNREQLARIVQEQKRRHKPIGEALVELGHLDETELEDLLDRYHLALIDLDVAHLGLPLMLADDDLAAYLVEYLPRLHCRVTRDPMKLQAPRPWHGRCNLPHRIEIALQGFQGMRIGLAACDRLAAQIARSMSLDATESPDGHAIEAAFQEFAEIYAEAGLRSARDAGVELVVSSPHPGHLPDSGTWLPATTPDGRGVLILERL